MATIAVITPSRGRKSLLNVINHTSSLLQPGDMHFVGMDTLAPKPSVSLSDLPALPLLHAEEMPVLRSVFGNGQRDLLLQQATTGNYDWAIFCDDDDLLNEAGVVSIRQLEPDGKLHIFTMRTGLGAVHSCHGKLAHGNVGGGMLVIRPTTGLPKWMNVNLRESDLHFAQALIETHEVVLHPEVILNLDCA